MKTKNFVKVIFLNLLLAVILSSCATTSGKNMFQKNNQLESFIDDANIGKKLSLEDAPISSLGWHYEGDITLNGKPFHSVAKSYCETDGSAFVESLGKVHHYWLYNTYKYHNGNGQPILDTYIPKWVESMGYTIDYENLKKYSPNENLAESVKMLMKNRNSDVSVALITDNGLPYVIINNYDKKNKEYSTYILDLLEDSIKLTEKAKSGDSNAQYNLGWMYENGKGVTKDYKKAIYWLTKAAEQGNTNAQFSLGWMYANSKDVVKDDKKAVYWYTKAAEQGHIRAQYNVGRIYINEKSTVRDPKKGVYWITKSAEQGNLDAQFWLSFLYYFDDDGVPHDYEKAIYWLTKAAEQGAARAQHTLGLFYLEGLITAQDDKKAIYWIKKAADQGYEKAKESLKKIQTKTSQKVDINDMEAVYQKYEELIIKYEYLNDNGAEADRQASAFMDFSDNHTDKTKVWVQDFYDYIYKYKLTDAEREELRKRAM